MELGLRETLGRKGQLALLEHKGRQAQLEILAHRGQLAQPGQQVVVVGLGQRVQRGLPGLLDQPERPLQ